MSAQGISSRVSPREGLALFAQVVERKATLHGRSRGCRCHVSGKALSGLMNSRSSGKFPALLWSTLTGEFLGYNTTCFSVWHLQFWEEENDAFFFFFVQMIFRLFRRLLAFLLSFPWRYWTIALSRRECLSLFTFRLSTCLPRCLPCARDCLRWAQLTLAVNLWWSVSIFLVCLTTGVPGWFR